MAISGAIKALAKELNVPIIVLSQLRELQKEGQKISQNYLICVILGL